MPTPGSHEVAFTISGPITRGDLPGLCDRVCGILASGSAQVANCNVSGVRPDAATVDALARLQLAARRHGCSVQLHNASCELLELVDFMGLTDVCRADDSDRAGFREANLGERSSHG